MPGNLRLGPSKARDFFDRIVFNFPLLPAATLPRCSAMGAQIANRAMLVSFLETASEVLAPQGLIIIASKDCYPYSWWQIESLAEWARGDLVFAGKLPWSHTEYPLLYTGPCNVNRDQSVKPTDAFVYLFCKELHHIEQATGGASLRGIGWSHGTRRTSGSYSCNICHVGGLASVQDLAQHEAGRIHKKRVALEECWKAALPKLRQQCSSTADEVQM